MAGPQLFFLQCNPYPCILWEKLLHLVCLMTGNYHDLASSGLPCGGQRPAKHRPAGQLMQHLDQT